MEGQLNHDALDAALKRCGATWGAAQSHGLLTGRLAVAGPACGEEWLGTVLDGVDASNAMRSECEKMLSETFGQAYRQLAERLSQFEPLLPDDADNADVRAAGLAHWCEGFLHGLVSAPHGDELKKQLAADPLADIIKDMLQITRAAVSDDDDDEANEAAYAELVEYLRVAAQLAFEELADIRDAGAPPAA